MNDAQNVCSKIIKLFPARNQGKCGLNICIPWKVLIVWISDLQQCFTNLLTYLYHDQFQWQAYGIHKPIWTEKIKIHLCTMYIIPTCLKIMMSERFQISMQRCLKHIRNHFTHIYVFWTWAVCIRYCILSIFSSIIKIIFMRIRNFLLMRNWIIEYYSDMKSLGGGKKSTHSASSIKC